MKRTSQLLLKGTLLGAFALLATSASAHWVPMHNPGCPMAAPNTGCAMIPYQHHFRGHFNGAPCNGAPCYQQGQPQVPPCFANPGNFNKGPTQSFQERKDFLLDSLQLNDSQKSAWDNYSSAVDALHSLRQSKIPQGPQLDRQKFLEERAARLQKSADATQALLKARAELLKVLTPEQAKTLEMIENRNHFRGHRGIGHQGYGAQVHRGYGYHGHRLPMPKAPA